MIVKCVNQWWWGLRNQFMILQMNEGKKLLISILPSLCELFHGVTKWRTREICLYRNAPADKERMVAWEKSSFCNPQWTDGSGHRLSAAASRITKRDIMCLLMENTIPSMKYSCPLGSLPTLHQKVKAPDPIAHFQGIQGSEKCVQWSHGYATAKIQTMANFTGQTTQLNCKGKEKRKKGLAGGSKTIK